MNKYNFVYDNGSGFKCDHAYHFGRIYMVYIVIEEEYNKYCIRRIARMNTLKSKLSPSEYTIPFTLTSEWRPICLEEFYKNTIYE